MYKGPATRGQEQHFKEARGAESTRIMTRGIPMKPYMTEANVPAIYHPRLSQCFDYSKLSALRQKILGPLTDRLEYFATGGGFNIKIVINDDMGSLTPINDKIFISRQRGYTEDYGRKPTKPLILHCALTHINKGEESGHALLLIYFPDSNELDIVSTYQMEPEERDAIGRIVGIFVLGRADLIVNDTMSVSGRYGFANIQKLESPSVGWCVTWMAYFTLIISKFPKAFWSLPYGNPRELELEKEASRLWFYRSMYVHILQNEITGPQALQVLADTLRAGGARKTRRRRSTTRRTRRLNRNYR
jgi:hypothetical protein